MQRLGFDAVSAGLLAMLCLCWAGVALAVFRAFKAKHFSIPLRIELFLFIGLWALDVAKPTYQVPRIVNVACGVVLLVAALYALKKPRDYPTGISSALFSTILLGSIYAQV